MEGKIYLVKFFIKNVIDVIPTYMQLLHGTLPHKPNLLIN
jgi:hypothetical protein